MSADRFPKLMAELEERYRQKTRRSLEVYGRAEKVLVSGGSHNLRIYRPYPFHITKARGAWARDVDGHDYIDYWQGHYANILGHNPAIIQKEMRRHHRTESMHTGFEGYEQIELAGLLLRRLERTDSRVRFTTSGTLATMYAVMLAKAYTGRDLVLKVGGGWHGASPFLLKGVSYHEGRGFALPESAGIPPALMRQTLVTRFNDTDDLKRILKSKGDRIACFILEPFIGVGGFLPASKDYLALARSLTARHGVVLIFDEIISGFRFCPSGVQNLYGVEADLSTFGKLIGGGHSVAAVVGRNEILERCQGRGPKDRARRVYFEGGTFSAHSEYMKAGLVMLNHLVANADKVYPRIGGAGELLRRGIEKAFTEQGFDALCTGDGNEAVAESSLFMLHFPRKTSRRLSPEDIWDPRRSDVRLREEALKLALLLEGVHVVHGGGAVSFAHGADEVQRTLAAYGEAAKLLKKYL